MKTASIITIILLMFTGSVFAQENSQQENIGEDHQLETIKVTASKRTEDLQEVPTAVTVFSPWDLEDKRILSVTDIAKFTPNFHIFDTGIMGLYTPAIRGKSGESSGSSVGLYVDGIPILTGSGFNDVLLDIERVEVLRGPQGTLYGKNTQVGAVNVISKPPDNTFSGKVTAEAGENQAYRLAAILNIPIIKDRVQMRVSGLHRQREGYLTYSQSGDDVDHRNYNYGKFNLSITPSDTFKIDFIASALEHDDGAINMNITDRYAEMMGLPAPDPKKVGSNLQGWNKSSSNMQVLKMVWDLATSWRFESVTSRRKYRDHYLNDWDLSSLDIMHKETDSLTLSYSQEFRGSYTGNGFYILAGLYGDSAKKHFKETNDITGRIDEDHTTKTNSLGLFANADLDLTEKIRLSGGVRYDKDTGEYEEPSRNRNISEDWGEISPRLSLSYTPVKEIMAYASVAKGYLPGGFNDHAGPDHPTTFDQENLWSYELGVKTRLFNDHLQLSLAIFYMNIDDYQVRIDASPEHNYTDNAAKAESSGFEVEARARLTDMLTLTADFGYTYAVFKDYQDAMGDYDGNRLPYAPEYSGALGLIFRHPKGIFAGFDVTGYGKMYLNKENDFPQDPYAIVNLKLGYESEDYDIYLYADNLFDKDYGSDGYFGGLYRVASPPREIGVTLNYRF